MDEDFRSRVPWNWQPHFSEICAEAGVDFDRFLESLAENRSDMELADEFSVSAKTIGYLRDHFENYGIGSVLGQD